MLMGEAEPASAAVVWWRHPSPPGEASGMHRIGWVDVTGRPHGRLDIPSPHLRLDPHTIETALRTHLVPHPYSEQPTILAAGLTEANLLSSEARLIVDGHTITDTDLSTIYGLDVVAVVSARLHAAGPRAVVAVEKTLHPAVRNAALTAATHAVTDFAHATTVELTTTGWNRRAEGRWQLVLHQH
jgi:hypothetical protein